MKPRCRTQSTRGDALPPWMRPGAGSWLVMQRCMREWDNGLRWGQFERVGGLIRELGREVDAMMAAGEGYSDGWMQMWLYLS